MAGVPFSHLYNYIKNSKKYRLYSSKLQKAPTPKCVCFYNGTKQMPDKMILKLSDAFDKNLDPDVEVKVTMLNINYGHNKDLLDRFKKLQDEVESMHKRASHVENALDETIRQALRDKDELYGKIIESKEEILKDLFLFGA